MIQQSIESFYLKSIENKNDYLIAIANIAIFYQNLGKFEEAKKFYLKDCFIEHY